MIGIDVPVRCTLQANIYIARDLVGWGFSAWEPQIPAPPPLKMAALMTVQIGLLGLGGLCTVEKRWGRSK